MKLATQLLCLLFLMSPSCSADSSALEIGAKILYKQIRCPLCVSQPIDESDTPIALELRTAISERIHAGESDRKILDFIVKRYGEHVLLNPPFRLSTYLLWFAPLIIISTIGLVLGITYITKKG